jgi:hypothetical protein
MSNILAVGPFIGSFEQEIMSFMPYARYLSQIMEYDDIFISSHSNRRFLYDWIDDRNYISINEKWTRDDCKQNGYVHDDVISSQFIQTSKDFKQKIKTDIKYKGYPIELYSLPYIKTAPIYSTIQKKFYPIRVPRTDIKEKDKDYVVFIADESISEETSNNIYNLLINEYNVLVIGDCKTHLAEKNVIMKRSDYVERVYELIYGYIHGAKFVITPCSYWTIICNIQNIPVFSWGESPGIYKSEGTFGFDNKNMIIYNDDNNAKSLVGSIGYFQKKL